MILPLLLLMGFECGVGVGVGVGADDVDSVDSDARGVW